MLLFILKRILAAIPVLFVLSVVELYSTFNIKQGITFSPFEDFLACAVWYLLLTTIWGVIQSWIERRLAKGTPGAQAAGPGLTARLIGLRNNSGNLVR